MPISSGTNNTEETPLLGGKTTEYAGTTPTTTTAVNTATTATTTTTTANKVNDEYIISLIRRTSTVHSAITNQAGDGDGDGDVANDGLLADDDGDDDGDDGDDLHGGTTYGQTIIHLVKGYVGCGILSLPWAISQLGIPLGLLGIVSMSLWSSYNCWTVVKLKRYIERTTINTNDDDDDDDSDSDDSDDSDADSDNNSDNDNEDDASKLSKVSKGGASSVASSNITYPDVGEWAHGIEFQKYISICICAQQLAICTVFISFVSENLLATVEFYLPGDGGGDQYYYLNHLTIGAMAMPLFLALSCGLPSLKSMAPFMLCGTILMLSGFASLGLIGYLKWYDRPTLSAGVELPTLKIDKNAPMALCGILYSFEGICIILPVESSMKYANTQFKTAFVISMIIVTILLCTMAGMGVYVFGEVSNGSITAFLLEEYKDDKEIQFWLMLSNLFVTISIIFSYPLMLFPAIELIAPLYYNWKISMKRKHYNWWNYYIRNKQNHANAADDDADDSISSNDSLGFSPGDENDKIDNDGEEEQNLEGFEPMVGIPEHSVASMGSLPSLPESTYQHEYNNNGGAINNQNDKNNSNVNGDNDISSSAAAAAAAAASDTETTKTGEATDGGGLSESASLSHLSSVDRSIVEGDNDDDGANNESNRSICNDTANRERQQRELSSAFEWNLPGDSPWLRAGIVIGTYLVAMIVPNVQSLVSLVGAVTGSSTALLIPPILELAYINHMETLRERGIRKPPHLGEWEGGPSTALKRTLFGSPVRHHHHHHITRSSSKRERSSNCRINKRRNKYLFKKILSWFLLILGSMFALVGSYFSIRDIIQSYTTTTNTTTATM